jgi:acetylornithine deacetylase/succinyl-diaminopimelate desuccinylase-like protein
MRKAMTGKQIDWNAAEKEAVELLCRYIQINTINPPGNELAGAKFLKEVLGKNGIAAELYESDRGRANLITRFMGDRGDKPEILLLHHIDVVPVEEDKWAHPPLSGRVIDGEVWGRGALDCKSLGIMQLMAVMLLKRQGLSPEKCIVLAATADEEAGSTWGAGWLMQHLPEKFRARYVINEGGGLGLSTKRGNLHFCQVAEKGVCWVRITFSGKPGHASLPHGSNCVVQMGMAIEALSSYDAAWVVTEPAEKFIRGLAHGQDFLPAAEFVKLLDPAQCSALIARLPAGILQQVLNASLRNTFTPTITKAGAKTNVIPGECYCEIDCRMLPGMKPEAIRKTIEKVLKAKGCKNFTIQMLHTSLSSTSPMDTPLYRAFEKNLKKHDPKALLIPYMSSGATDSRFFREQGIIAYGMQMESSLESMERMHGHNERIAITNLVMGIKVLYDTIQEFCA